MASARHILMCAAVASVAGGTGLLVGLLFAPVSGREQRRMIGRRLEEGRETIERKGRHAVEDLKEYADDTVEAMRERLPYVGGR